MDQHNKIGELQALNAQAADLIEEGDHEQAVEILNYALQNLSWCLLDPTPISDGTQLKPINSEDNPPSVHVYSHEDGSNEARNDFFEHPFLFECDSSNHEREGALSNEEYSSCAITCLFNTGLCYQLEWQERKKDVYLLQRAVKLYENAFSLTESCSSFAPTDSVLVVLMAVCANATHCESELANQDKSVLWNRRLQKILQFSKEHRQGCHRYFSMNAFLNGFERVTAGAA